MSRPTIIDIANRAGVSFKTVSRVLNKHPKVGEEYRVKVEQAMAELNFKPNRAAQQLRGGRSSILGLLVSSGAEIHSLDEGNRLPSYIADIITGMLQSCQAASFHLVTENIDNSNEAAGKAWLADCFDAVSFDGLLLMPPLCDTGWLLDELDARQVRYARMNPGTQLGRGLCLVIDNHSAGREIGAYLLDQGHRRLGYITGPASHFAHTGRLDGFREAMAQAPDAQLQVCQGAFTFASGQRAGGELLDGPSPPSAIFAANDEMAAGVLAAAFERGLNVPGQLSIFGFGGLLISQSTWPRISTVSQPTITMARMAADTLIAATMEDQELEARTIPIAYELKIRQSVAPPAAQ
ncbi:LacI family transcriptional regulator [Novosphingobium sp. SG751A]|uniref:LacI family DNA-binding transcriptional regulator n=1 Tax=Novosphingobium sp. SG751A TaxID=2587000 RepID=UPI0015536113|nr:LacI family DNA-binding transcriptional regulator [Novosphingobium sp. SG751A]NOW45766.1 LacI family transcriptional regulator [Novosphingobium sp. SG751A]